MEITITAKQFMDLKRINTIHSQDPMEETMHFRDLSLYLEECRNILGRETVNTALETGEEIRLRVDWTKR